MHHKKVVEQTRRTGAVASLILCSTRLALFRWLGRLSHAGAHRQLLIPARALFVHTCLQLKIAVLFQLILKLFDEIEMGGFANNSPVRPYVKRRSRGTAEYGADLAVFR